jgi:hypothetical protein
MIRKCAWCGEILGESPPLADQHFTHTVCPSCARLLLAEPPPENGAGAPKDGTNQDPNGP